MFVHFTVQYNAAFYPTQIVAVLHTLNACEQALSDVCKPWWQPALNLKQTVS